MNYKEISKEAFCLGLRFYGVVLIFQGLMFVHGLVTSLLQNFTMDTLLHYVYRGLYVVPAVLIGIWFLRGAPKLLSFCYPSDNQKVE
jgi:hypothetical protein